MKSRVSLFALLLLLACQKERLIEQKDPTNSGARVAEADTMKAPGGDKECPPGTTWNPVQRTCVTIELPEKPVADLIREMARDDRFRRAVWGLSNLAGRMEKYYGTVGAFTQQTRAAAIAALQGQDPETVAQQMGYNSGEEAVSWANTLSGDMAYLQGRYRVSDLKPGAIARFNAWFYPEGGAPVYDFGWLFEKTHRYALDKTFLVQAPTASGGRIERNGLIWYTECGCWGGPTATIYAHVITYAFEPNPEDSPDVYHHYEPNITWMNTGDPGGSSGGGSYGYGGQDYSDPNPVRTKERELKEAGIVDEKAKAKCKRKYRHCVDGKEAVWIVSSVACGAVAVGVPVPLVNWITYLACQAAATNLLRVETEGCQIEYDDCIDAIKP